MRLTLKTPNNAHFNVRSLDDDLLELVVVPGIGSSFHHGERSVVLKIQSDQGLSCVVSNTYEFIILDIQENKLWPKM